jgi:quercetin dioxygenase-like cupin family protein
MKKLIVGAASLVGLAILVIAATALATPPSGATAVPLAPVAQFAEIKTKAKSGDWAARIKTKGISDLHINQITIQPGGTFGWHSHPGPSFVIVKSGTATFYKADDPTCTPHVLPAGSSFFEPADDVHIPRNEGIEPLVMVVIQLLPTGATRRIDEPSPGNCSF